MFKVVAIAGCGDKWTEFSAQQTAAMRAVQRRGSWVKTRAALKSQLPTMYTSPTPPPSSSCYLSLSAIQHGTHLSLMAHRESSTHIPLHMHTQACLHVCSVTARKIFPMMCVSSSSISPLILSVLSLSPSQLSTPHTHTQRHPYTHPLQHTDTLILF